MLPRVHAQGSLGLLALALVAALVPGCAEVPKGQWGVDRMRFEGVEQVDEETLRVCLATHERESVVLGMSALREPTCGAPPFDKSRAALRLWSWPWKDWPTYDEAILKLDVERIERWYAARGYYRAHVVAVRFDPPAMNGDAACKEDCEGTVTIQVTEGEPVRLRNIAIDGDEALAPPLREELREALELARGQIFDEAEYAAARERLAKVLREAGHARAQTVGDVAVHRGLLYADVTLHVTPGPLCTFGSSRVKSSTKVPEDTILAVTKLKRGDVYHESELASAQHAVYALGAFSAVNVRGDFEGEGSEIPIVIEVTPRRESEVMLGAGLMSGVLSNGANALESISVPQWDAHLLGSYENRNFFGGLRQFHIEERPRLLFLGQFPTVPDNSPRFANAIQARFAQPGVLEPRTTLFVESGWDYGPDPFLLFFRHDVANAIGLERAFFEGRLSTRAAVHMELMELAGRQPDYVNERFTTDDSPLTGPDDTRIELPSSYRLPYLEQRVTVDLRDDAASATKGGYFSMGIHEALPLTDRSWTYLRMTPDLRGYAPLGLGFVLAARFALGSIHIFEAGSGLDDLSQQLGPQSYRLRGGGANSNRGFAPGKLGDGIQGGIRRWESSLELRIPIAKDFSVATFADAGDVHAGKSFRFNHLNTAVGGGLRYRTIIGPIRLDVGVRPRKLARADGSAPADDPRFDLGFTKFHGAVHLTIGEAF